MIIELKILILLIVANAAPIFAARWLGDLYACPLDMGKCLPDGQPWFGPSKTGRGIIAAILACVAVGFLLNIHPQISVLLALFAMLGDLTSSFIKRRLHKPSSSRFIGLDQVPESLFPLLVVKEVMAFSMTDIVVMVLLFTLSDLLVSRLLYKWHVRKHPY